MHRMHWRYLLKKALILAASLFLIITLTFVFMKVIPGDPFMQEQAIPKEIIKALHKHYGLDDPLLVQYIRYLKGIMHFDFGPSFKYVGRSVSSLIAASYPVSFLIGAQAIIIAFCGGVFLGTLAATHRGQWQDQLAMLIGVIGISVPSFITASVLQYILAMKLNILPVALWGTWKHTIMPTISLSAIPMAFIARLTRANVVETLEQDYILTARSKGLSTFQIIKRHVLRNSLIPVIAYLGPLTAVILTGSFVIEKIFGVPGLGSWFVLSIGNRDYTMIMGLTIFYSSLLLIAVFSIDILCAWLDPRIQYGKDR